MKIRKLLALMLTFSMLCGILSACGGGSTPAPEAPSVGTETPTETPAETPAETPSADSGELPRNETLYFGGLQWGRVVGWNPLSNDNNNALVFDWGIPAARVAVYESLYMYNPLDGKFYPLLAEGDYTWNDAQTELTVKINPAAKWSDGTPVTAEDVAYTYECHLKYDGIGGLDYKDFISTIEAVDAQTAVLKATVDEQGAPVNPLKVSEFLTKAYIAQKAYLQALEERNGGEADAVKNDPCNDFVASGPYLRYFDDDQKVVLIRDDNYWGVALWGKLPVPKYLCHTIYPDNAAIQVAFAAGEIDVNQQFIENIQNMWLRDGLPISTYIDEEPYGICVAIPSAWYNFNNPVLQEPAIRKAIALAVDYDAIIANAMTNQSPSFKDVPRSLMNPTDGEQAMFDHDAVKDLQWAGNDIEGAIALLDEAGIVDSDGDGWREYNGEKISLNCVCPNGWTDWQAAMEIVAAAGSKIGIEITTYFPEWSVYQTVFTDGTQTEYDIFMWSGEGAGPTMPWARVRQYMSSEFVGLQSNWTGNYGGYVNERADEIIAQIPTETDAAKLKELYTEAVEIYLQDVPSFALMYRPGQFHAVNESVWTGFPEQGDGLNIPPTNLLNGYGAAGLYNIELVNP